MALLLFQAAPQQKPKPADPTEPPMKTDAQDAAKKADSADKSQKPKKPGAVDPTEPPMIEIEQKPTPPKVYTYNPVQAKREMDVGAYHMRRSNWAAAESRYEEATKWNPRMADAWLKLAEAREKRGESEKAIEAYQKYLQLEPHAKKKSDVEKSIARLQKDIKE